MIVRKTLDPRVIIRVGWKRVLTLIIISVVAVIIHTQTWFDISIDPVPASILGVAIAFLIGFRVNSAYERWWEARRLWGSITNDSRSFARQILSIASHPGDAMPNVKPDNWQRKVIMRQIAFCYALKNSLRKVDVYSEIADFVSKEELDYLKSQKNVANAILQLQAHSLTRARAEEKFDELRLLHMDTRLNSLADAMGGCERIKNTVFPRQYSYYSTLFVRIYSYLLPFVFVGKSGWGTVAFAVLIGFIYFALDAIASGIENPFENSFNDTPMNAICRNIEINLLQMLGETDLPKPVEPVNGFLY
jgi:putative membrane protein